MSKYSSDRYATFSYDDETSSFDPKGEWMPGSEYYACTYRCRVPRKMLERAQAAGNHDAVHDWIERNQDKPIWL